MKSSTRNRLIVLAVLIIAGFVLYQQFASPLPVMAEAREALIPSETVSVQTDPYLVFAPAQRNPRAGLVFYAGARIEPEAYAPLGRALAEEGFLVAIPKMPFNFAFLGISTANDVLADYPDLDEWAVGGHSLGGAMAASFADRTERVDGLLLVAAYPGSSLDLSNRTIEVIVVYGNMDEVALADEILASQPRLPETAEFIVVPGGNHAQFGYYGVQAGDGAATISRAEQQSELVSAALRLMRSVDR